MEWDAGRRDTLNTGLSDKFCSYMSSTLLASRQMETKHGMSRGEANEPFLPVQGSSAAQLPPLKPLETTIIKELQQKKREDVILV